MTGTILHSLDVLWLTKHQPERINSDSHQGQEAKAGGVVEVVRFARCLFASSPLLARGDARPVRPCLSLIHIVLRGGYTSEQNQQAQRAAMDCLPVKGSIGAVGEAGAGRSVDHVEICFQGRLSSGKPRRFGNSSYSLPEEVAHGLAPGSASIMDRSRWASLWQYAGIKYLLRRLVDGVYSLPLQYGVQTVSRLIRATWGYRLGSWLCDFAGYNAKDRTRRYLPPKRTSDNCGSKDILPACEVRVPLAVPRGCDLASVQTDKQTSGAADRQVSFPGLHETHNGQLSRGQRLGGTGTTTTRALLAGHHAAVLPRPEDSLFSFGNRRATEHQSSLAFLCVCLSPGPPARPSFLGFRGRGWGFYWYLCGLPVGPDGEKSCGRIALSSTH